MRWASPSCAASGRCGLAAVGCVAVLVGVIVAQRLHLESVQREHRRQLDAHEKYWQMRYSALQRMSDAKDRARRLSEAMEKDLRLGTGRAYLNAALRNEEVFD